mmetsp:Transcript_25371/g.59020  ORF Transcript_25371/g.59020 Transcript_25371/m.59020 type:complete len:445 (-) Transcript_25371:187-1521(-)
MHSQVQRAIWHESTVFLNDRHLFDPSYFCFVWNLLRMVLELPAVARSASSSTALAAVQVGVRFAVEVLAHARAKACVGLWCGQLIDLVERHPEAGAWLVAALAEPLGSHWLAKMVVVCPHDSTKDAFVQLLVRLVATFTSGARRGGLDLQPDGPSLEAAPDGAGELRLGPAVALLDAVLGLMENPRNVALFSMMHVFQLLDHVARLGATEQRLLLELDAPSRAIAYFLPRLGKNSRSLTPMMQMLATLVCAADVGPALNGRPRPPVSPEAISPPDGAATPRLLATSEQALLIRPWLEDAIAASPAEAGRIIQHLCWECSTDRAGKLYKVLVERVLEATSCGSPNGNYTSVQYRPYFQTLAQVLKMRDSLLVQRAKHCLPHLMARCPRLLERQNPGDDELLYDISKLLLWFGARAPALGSFLAQERERAQGWGSWAGIWALKSAT